MFCYICYSCDCVHFWTYLGRKVPELQDLGLCIFHVCVSFVISLEIKWIPRSSNSQADHLSSIIDFDDYTLMGPPHY